MDIVFAKKIVLGLAAGASLLSALTTGGFIVATELRQEIPNGPTEHGMIGMPSHPAGPVERH